MPRRAGTPKSAQDAPPSSAKSLNRSSTSSGAARYRRLALGHPEAIESSHMGAADFRVNGRIFATLAYEAKGFGTLKLTPEQQAACLSDAPEHFTPAPGGWGRMGSTLVRLDAPEDVIAGALGMAYRQVAQRATKQKVRRPPSA